MTTPIYNTSVYLDQNGNELVVGPGGVITVQAGGTINVQSGGAVTGIGGGSADPNLAKGSLGATFPAASVGNTVSIRAPYAGTINSVIMDGFTSAGAPATGSAVVGIAKNGASIVGSDAPTLNNQGASTDSSLPGWTLSFAANDLLAFTLSSITTLGQVTCTLATTKA